MGKEVWNIEQVLDRRNDKHSLRLHMDIPLAIDESKNLQKMMDSHDYDGALMLLKKKIPAKLHKSLEDVFAVLKR
jgi:hypothetical protein